MKRPALMLTAIGGLVVFLGVLVLYLPASWFASALPAQVRCSELGGSIWEGECLGLTFQNGKLGDVTWSLATGNAFAGRLVGNLVLVGDAQRLKADFDVGRDGAGQITNLDGYLQMDPAVLPRIPSEQRGMVIANFKHIELTSGGAPRKLNGTLQLNDLRQVGATPMAFGSYELTFDGASQPDGSVVSVLRDRGGPFIVTGTVTFAPSRTYVVQGFVTGRTADAERLVRENTLGPPDASGRTAFSYEDSY